MHRALRDRRASKGSAMSACKEGWTCQLQFAHPQNFSRDFAFGGISLNVTKEPMKTLRSLITACIAIFALSSVAFALPPWKTGAPLSTLTTKSQFEELKGGDKVVLFDVIEVL